MGDCACGHVAVDGKLFAGHTVECEARANLGHAARTLCNNDKVDDHQYAEDHQPHENRAPHDEHGKPVNNVTSRRWAGVALADNQFGRGHIQGQTQHQTGQKDGRER